MRMARTVVKSVFDRIKLTVQIGSVNNVTIRDVI